jgi:perosamine synthetase
MINLFNINEYDISTSSFDNWLNGSIVAEFEETIASYVGAKYACSFNSASSAIFLSLLNKNITANIPSLSVAMDENTTVNIPSMLPPVVANMILNSGNSIEFRDDVDWVGGSYVLHDFGNYKIIDSAQRLIKNQFRQEANAEDLMLFSFYPTKPVGSCDGGMIVSDDYDKIAWFKMATQNGTIYSKNSWDRRIAFPGWKMYMNSMQAYIAMENFKRYEDKLAKISKVRELYNAEFGYSNTSDHLYRINVADRESVIDIFNREQIGYGIHYEPLHLNSVYSDCIGFNIMPPELDKTEGIKDSTLSIPLHENLSTQDIDCILDVVSGKILL